MFGYVRPSDGRLTEADRETFRGAYCGLCHTLGRRYGLVGRMILNYDLTFLAMVLSHGTGETCDRRCAVHPFRKRRCAAGDPAFDTAADMSVILTWWQLRDGVTDHGFLRGLKYRLAVWLLTPAYRKARRCREDFDRQTEAHLGRWVYLIDAADDLSDDLKSGSYNPLALRFAPADGKLAPADEQSLAATLDGSVRAMAAAFELTDCGVYTPVVRAVVYEGLYAVGASVLAGTFHKRVKREEPIRKADTDHA